MAANNDIKVAKTVKWPEVVARTSADSGIPKKQLEEDFGQVTETVSKLIEETRPQKVGTCTIIHTPLGAIRNTKIPSEIRTDISTGKKVEREECFSISIAAPKKFVDAANVGLVLDKADAGKDDKKSKKTA
jgi:hypothetical protein